MINSQIRVITENYRAIQHADIVINGITVVAGENGSGKSTLSKLLYHLYKTASNYDLLIAQELKYKLKNIIRFLEIVVTDLYKLSNERNTREEFKEFNDLRFSLESVAEIDKDRWLSFIEKIENNYYSQPSLFKEKNELNPRLNNRLNYIVKDILDGIDKDYNLQADASPFKVIKQVIEILFDESLNKIKARPTSLFLKELINLYSEGVLPKKFEVFEYGDQIVSLNRSGLSIPYIIQNSIYIDTPMIIGVEHFSDNDHWDDLNEILLQKVRYNDLKISKVISNEIISGEVNFTESEFSDGDLSYRRKDGSVFKLLECATGVKSFAILQLLLKNGYLNDKTLLIIDEPESHLHPQWIIEYARIIVLLNKQLGVKFFIASHNPDMISAIRYISEKEEVLENLNFYLSQKNNYDYTYRYVELGQDIDPIFASFNIALDRINQYGV